MKYDFYDAISQKISSIPEDCSLKDGLAIFCEILDSFDKKSSDRSTESEKPWPIALRNSEKHQLHDHQVDALLRCYWKVANSDSSNSGYCFMPTSAGKGHIIVVLAALCVSDFYFIKQASLYFPDHLDFELFFPVAVSFTIEFLSKSTIKFSSTKVLIHDLDILEQIKEDAAILLGPKISRKISFASVQSMRAPEKRKGLKFAIVDECHWGNASEEETIQSSLISEVTSQGGCGFGFTASPYPDGKFQKTWAKNCLSEGLGFDYYLDRNILYPVTLREVNLQNARIGYQEGDEEIDLTEKPQVIDFLAQFISSFVSFPLDGPAIGYFNASLIPDLVASILKMRPDLSSSLRVLGSDLSNFSKMSKLKFGKEILATDEDIKRLKKGEKVFIISRQKLIVGLNAPFLKYCFIGPTNSKITIMQAVGRLMRPIDFSLVPKKTAVLFLSSLSGKKVDFQNGDADGAKTHNKQPDPDGHDHPKKSYTTTSMTLSEAYGLKHAVHYKVEVGFRDFINETRVGDGNSVISLNRGAQIDFDDLESTDWEKLKKEIKTARSMSLAQYKNFIIKRDSAVFSGQAVWCCQGETVLGDRGCARTNEEVNLEIHHILPYTFASLFKSLGRDGVLAWHADPKNWKHLISLCEGCHKEIHSKKAK